jgi:hypothetical protein
MDDRIWKKQSQRRKAFHQIVRENGITFFLKEWKLKQNIVAQ